MAAAPRVAYAEVKSARSCSLLACGRWISAARDSSLPEDASWAQASPGEIIIAISNVTSVVMAATLLQVAEFRANNWNRRSVCCALMQSNAFYFGAGG